MVPIRVGDLVAGYPYKPTETISHPAEAAALLWASGAKRYELITSTFFNAAIEPLLDFDVDQVIFVPECPYSVT